MIRPFPSSVTLTLSKPRASGDDPAVVDTITYAEG